MGSSFRRASPFAFFIQSLPLPVGAEVSFEQNVAKSSCCSRSFSMKWATPMNAHLGQLLLVRVHAPPAREEDVPDEVAADGVEVAVVSLLLQATATNPLPAKPAGDAADPPPP